MDKIGANIKRPILHKLILWILLPLCAVYIVILGVSYWLSSKSSTEMAEAYLEEICRHHSAKLEGKLQEAATQTAAIASMMQLMPKPSVEQLQTLLASQMQQNRFLSGITFAYEPYAYNPETRLLAPYLCRRGDEVETQDISDSYDYTQSDWYQPVIKNLKPYWTEPYLGGASKVLNASYLHPAIVNNQLLGVAGADLSLSELTAQLAELELKPGYAFLISYDGLIISHPQQSLILNSNIKELVNTTYPEYKELVTRKTASAVIPDARDAEGRRLWISHREIPSSGWLFAVVMPHESVMAETRAQLKVQLLIMLIGLVVVVGIIIYSSVQISKPLRTLSHQTRLIAGGDLDLPLVETGGKDEIEALSRDFGQMVLRLKDQMTRLKEMTEARARVESELSIARSIQQSLLPHVFPPYPQRDEFALYAQMIPARDVAGDFFDFFFVDPDHLVLIIADVSGKGIPAALFMAVSRTLLKTACDYQTSPAEALQKANKVLSLENDNCMFTTLFIAIYEVSTGELCYANAGHLPPLIFCSDGGSSFLQSFGDPALGIVEDHVYHEACASLQIGDRLIFYTDGVTEALDRGGNLYGIERFSALLAKNLEEPIQTVQQRIQEDLISYQNGELADDITMLFFSRKK